MLRGKRLAPCALVLADVVLCVLLSGCGTTSAQTTLTQTPARPGCASVPPTGGTCAPRLLVFTKTQAFRHASIPAAKAAVQLLACQRGWRVDFTEDSGQFSSTNLAHYDAVLFLLTTGNVLDTTQKTAFEQYIHSGGGFAGVHSASDTEYSWTWYDGLVGAHNNMSNKHSAVVRGTIEVTDRTNISTAMLPARWTRTDEWYNFATNPRPRVHVLMTMDDTTYRGGTMGADHPIAWYHPYDGGRAWYTALGHTVESYSEPLFLAHLAGGLAYALGRSTAATSGSPTACAGQAGQASQASATFCGETPDAAGMDAAYSVQRGRGRPG